MKFIGFKNELSKLTAENKLLKFLVILIFLSNIILGIFCYSAVKVKNVILIPVGYTRPIIAGRVVDKHYIMEIARFLMEAMFNYTPNTIRSQYELLLTFFDPSVYHKYKQIFSKYVEEAEAVKTVSSFLVDKIEEAPKQRIVKVTGRRIMFLGNQVVSDESVTYAFKYDVKYGRFRILKFGKLDAFKDELSR